MEVSHGFFEYNSSKYSYDDVGSGQPVIFLCGWGSPCAAADIFPIARQLGEGYRFIALDRPGYGDTDTAAKDDYLHVLAAFVEHLGLEDYILVGHSLGTLYSLNYAKGRSGIRGVVLIDSFPVGGLLLKINRSMGRMTASARKKGVLEKMSDEKLLETAASNYDMPDELRALTLRRIRTNQYNDRVLAEIEAFKDTPKTIYKGMETISAPVICLCRKQTYKANLKYAKYIPGCRVIRVENSSHYIHHDHPDITSEVILEL